MEQFTYVKRGYDPEEVDRYIATLEQVVRSYKEKDNAIKNAIISAQIAADNMIKNARAQAEEYKGQIAKELDKLTGEVDRQRMKIKAFQDVYAGMVRKYLTELDSNDVNELHHRLDDVDKFILRLKDMDIVPAGAADDAATPEPDETPDASANTEPVYSDASYYEASHYDVIPEAAPVAPALPPPSVSPRPKQPAPPLAAHAPPPMSYMPPPKGAVPQPLSLGPMSSPSLNKHSDKTTYAPQATARINEDDNYVPST
ncbi:MAG: DivIVA domain-containing protein [Defluviitaleaceae bacterium]|nr:DivIVA domain-containing protein [Defluviitaleaceae bacterium]